MLERAYPGKLPTVIGDAFRVAQTRHVAVHFSIESHYAWEARPDLWNYFDPQSPGYDPDNKNNVEWTDWQGSPCRHRYLDWGTPQEMAPPMCLNAPRIKAEIDRLVREVIGPPIRNGVASLADRKREDLFAGVTVTAEPMIEDYSIVDELNPNLGKYMDERHAAKAKLGFNALTCAGYTAENPPKDMKDALGNVIRDFGAHWAGAFVKAGIPGSRLYTHVAANAGVPGTRACSFTNAPISAAFNPSCRPGWTTYATGPLQRGLGPIHDELARRGHPHWASSEASPAALGGLGIPTYEYLRWHFGHGATLVVMNTGATSEELTRELEQGVWGTGTIAAYQRFLAGR